MSPAEPSSSPLPPETDAQDGAPVQSHTFISTDAEFHFILNHDWLQYSCLFLYKQDKIWVKSAP